MELILSLVNDKLKINTEAAITIEALPISSDLANKYYSPGWNAWISLSMHPAIISLQNG
jgi:hypothetical protein